MYKIEQILPSLFSKIGIEEAVKLKFLQKKWMGIFDAPINEHTWPKNLKKGILYVTVDSHIWLAELKLLKENFLNKVKSYGIDDVEFSYGRIYRRNCKNTEHKTTFNISENQKKWIDELTRNIRDEEIKNLTENVIKKSLIFLNSSINGKKILIKLNEEIKNGRI
jgi:hypothetical protein